MNIAISAMPKRRSKQFRPAMPLLSRNDIAGDFSLTGNGPLVIDAIPGMTLRVRTGLVQVCQLQGEGQQLVAGGQVFVINRTSPFGFAALTPAQVCLDWPPAKTAPRRRASAPMERVQ